jgi:hypothetical protein
VSAAASGRLTPRLIADGMVSFSFVPIFEWLAFAVLWRTRLAPARHGRQWSAVAASFLDGNQPWLLWLVVAGALVACVPPRALGPWILPLEISLLLPIFWSVRIDLRFFRGVLARTPRAAILDVIAFRAIAWTLGISYFLGIAIWAELGL